MTKLLQQAFAAASQLPDEEQDQLAARLLAELTEEDEFDRKIESTGNELSRLAKAAMQEYAAGQTEVLDPNQL
ncbi:hypothetical protein [Planctomicrobium piriforme]|uniref:Uncharacterized protein n=1 Tax=Planctomicrobium piriforme TaxID=1576369 RepID=A0A1I3C622_9PLAN|nr:hypothetical protein [Planctomicrobium piriforme]SFH69977.1 hypothetical protein SAMN05421753_102130 [Planctomicrobium piriforme]